MTGRPPDLSTQFAAALPARSAVPSFVKGSFLLLCVYWRPRYGESVSARQRNHDIPLHRSQHRPHHWMFANHRPQYHPSQRSFLHKKGSSNRGKFPMLACCWRRCRVCRRSIIFMFSGVQSDAFCCHDFEPHWMGGVCRTQH